MLLQDYISKYKKRVSEFALEIGVTRDCVYKYMTGQRRPSDENLLVKIFHATDGHVTANDFYDLPKKPKRRSK